MTIILNEKSSEPIYSQIYSQISSQILNGNLIAGKQLPAIRTVASDLNISVIPVKMAWDNLDKNGFIKTITGKGTFVADISSEQIKKIKNEKLFNFANEVLKKAQNLNISIKELVVILNQLDNSI